MAGLLGLLAVACCMLHRFRLRQDTLTIPYLALIPALLVAGLLLQWAIGRMVFPQLGVLHACYLVWAALMLLLGRYLADVLGLARLATLLATALVLAALLGAMIGIAQWLGHANGVPWIFPPLGGGSHGNLGQANHHAHYCWLGIGSAFYLRTQGHLSRGGFWFLLLAMSFTSILSGSRSIFLYLPVLLVVHAWARRRDPRGQAAMVWGDALALLPVIVALSIFATWAAPRLSEYQNGHSNVSQALTTSPDENRIGASVMAGARLRESLSGPSERVALARSAWSAFGEHPWLGQGAGNFRWASFVAGAEQAEAQSAATGEHAHNVVLQLLAEFGAPITLMVGLLLIAWATQFVGQAWTPAQVWCASMLGIGAVHSLLEYPLWYSYFLGPTALLLGATNLGPRIDLAPARGAAYLCLLAVTGTVVLGSLFLDYRKLEVASNFPFALDADRERAWRMSMDQVLEVHRGSLLSPWALWTLVILAEPSRQLAQDRAVLCERAIRFSPARWLVARCATQLALAGRSDEARRLTAMVLRAYPAQAAATLGELREAATIHPEIAALRDVAEASRDAIGIR